MTPLLKLRNDYKNILTKLSEYVDNPYEDMLYDDDVLAYLESLSQKEWDELTEDDIDSIANSGYNDLAQTSQAQWEHMRQIMRDFVESQLTLKRYTPYYVKVLMPAARIFNLIIQRAGIEYGEEETAIIHFTAADVYDSLIDTDEYYAAILIRKIGVNSPSITEKLLTSFSNKDKSTFVSTINEEKCDVSFIEKYFSQEMVQFSSLSSGMLSIADGLENRDLTEYDKQSLTSYIDYLGDLISNDDDDTDENKETYYEVSVKKPSDIMDALQDYDEDSFESVTALTKTIADSILSTCNCMAPIYVDLFFELLSSGELLKNESAVFESIFTRPEGIEIYNERKAAFDKKKESALIDEQLQEQEPEVLRLSEGELNKTNYDAIKEFVLPDNLMRLPSVRQYNDFFAVFKLDIHQLKDILDYLVKNSYISDNDRGILAFRLTGREEIKPKELYQIQWTCQKKPGSPKELYYLLLCVEDDDKYTKVKEFFTGVDWPEEKRQKDMAREASSTFKRFFNESIDKTIFKLYRTKE